MSLQYSERPNAVSSPPRSPPDSDPFAAAVHGARMPMLVTADRRDGHVILFVNAAFTALTGYSAEEALGRNPRFLQGPDTDPRAVEALRAALREERETFIEVLNYRKDGSPFWNGMFLSPIRGANGQVSGWFGSQLDISGRKAAELALTEARNLLEAAMEQRNAHLKATAEQKAVLLHEVEHRVKNNLQLISSLIQFQARRTADPAVKTALKQVQERIGAVSTAHRRLFQADDAGRFDLGQFLRDLADDLVGRTRRADIAVALEVEPVTAPAAKAAPLALVINEILGEAVASGFPPGRGGRLDLSLRPTLDGAVIALSDDGEGQADERRQRLGGPTGIVEILRRQLGAEIEWRDNQPGAAAFITLPEGPRPPPSEPGS